MILTLLVLTPIFSIKESLALIMGGIVNNSTALTPVYIKAIKDLCFVLISFVSKKREKKSRFLSFTYLQPSLV